MWIKSKMWITEMRKRENIRKRKEKGKFSKEYYPHKKVKYPQPFKWDSGRRVVDIVDNYLYTENSPCLHTFCILRVINISVFVHFFKAYRIWLSKSEGGWHGSCLLWRIQKRSDALNAINIYKILRKIDGNLDNSMKKLEKTRKKMTLLIHFLKVLWYNVHKPFPEAIGWGEWLPGRSAA